jgi:hypothetical protein
LVYMCRNIQYNKNPYPDDFAMVHDTFYTSGTNPKYDKPKDDFQAHIKAIFNPFKKLDRR